MELHAPFFLRFDVLFLFMVVTEQLNWLVALWALAKFKWCTKQ